MVNFIDTHIHLQEFKNYCALINSDEALKFLCVSAQKKDWNKVRELSNLYEYKVVPAYGIHPWYLNDENEISEVEEYLKVCPQALVGEIGLDGVHAKIDDKQRDFFARQLKLAVTYCRPVIIHAVKAYNDIRLYEKELHQVKFVIHGYTKNFELLKFINKCNGYFGIGQRFLQSKNAVEMWQQMPSDKVLFETDAPFGVKEDIYAETVQQNLLKLAVIAGVPVGELTRKLQKNAEEFING